MNDQQALREQLWDYGYGLLSAEEAARLELRIRSEPKVARLYAEVRLELELVGMAARVDDRAFQLPAEVIARTKRETVPHKKSRHPAKSSAASWNWLLATAASGLIGLIAYGLIQPKQSADLLAGNFLAARVFAPGALADGAITEGITQRVELQTSNALAQPQSARVDLVVRDAAGKEQLRKSVVTASDGRAEVELPGDVLTVGSQLEVLERSSAALPESAPAAQPALIAALPVRPAPKETYFFLEAPRAEAGQPLAYSSVEVNQVTKQAAGPVVSRALAVEKDLRNNRSAAVSQALDRQRIESRERERLASSAAAKVSEIAAASAPAGGLAGKSPQAESANGRAADPVAAGGAGVAEKSFGGALKTTPPGAAFSAEPPRLAQRSAKPAAAVEQVPSAAQPTAEPLPQKAEEHAKQRDAAPPPPAGVGSAKRGFEKSGLSDNLPGAPPAPAAPTAGSPRVGAALGDPAGAADEAADKLLRKMLPPDEKQLSRRNAGGDPQAPSERFHDRAEQRKDQLAVVGLEPVTIPLATADHAKPLLARVRVGGEVVFQRALEGSVQAPAVEPAAALRKAGSAEVAVELPPEVDGQIVVELLDLSVSPPRLAGQREVLRRSERALSFAVEQIAGELKPGGKVKYRVQVQDEQGAPAAAAVSVRVWKAEALAEMQAALGGEARLLLAQKSAAEPPAQQNRQALPPSPADAVADGGAFKLQAGSAPAARPAEADKFEAAKEMRALETSAEASNHAPAPAPTASDLRWDNQSAVAQRYVQALAEAEAVQAGRMQRIGFLLLGLGVVVLAAPWLLSACSRPVGRPVWWTAVGTASLALVLGLVWAAPKAEPPSHVLAPNQTAAASAQAASSPKGEELRLESHAQPAPTGAAGPAVASSAAPDRTALPLEDSLNAVQKGDFASNSAAIFWRPPLPLEQPGWLEFEVELPKEPGSYQILLDGFGQGRLGSHQHPLTISAGEQPQ